jgi:hypothetical protein
MSSIGFRQIGKSSTLTGLVKSLVAEYQKFVAKSITIETTDFKSLHRSAQSLLKYNEMELMAKDKPVTTQFYAPYEPDFKNVVLMLGLNQMGRYAIDSSGFGNRGRIAGAGYAPQVVMDDGIDIGFGENSNYFHFDGLYTFVYVEDAANLRAQKVNSMTFTFRLYLMPHSWEPSDPNDITKPRYIFAKSDDDQQQNGYACAMDSYGSLKFTWVRNGVRTTVVTPIGTIATKSAGYTDTGYTPTGFDVESVDMTMMNMNMAIAVFNVAILCNMQEGFDPNGYDSNGYITGSGNDIQIAVDSSFLLSPDTGFDGDGFDDGFELDAPQPLGQGRAVITYYNTQSQDHLDLFVGNQEDLADDIDDPNAALKIPNFHENFRLRIGAAYPFTDDQQAFYKWHGGIQDFRIYRDMQIDEGDLQFLFDNKLTIANYPFAQIAWAGYTLVLPTAVGCCGFDFDGFDGAGFDNGFIPKQAIAKLTENVHVGH